VSLQPTYNISKRSAWSREREGWHQDSRQETQTVELTMCTPRNECNLIFKQHDKPVYNTKNDKFFNLAVLQSYLQSRYHFFYFWPPSSCVQREEEWEFYNLNFVDPVRRTAVSLEPASKFLLMGSLHPAYRATDLAPFNRGAINLSWLHLYQELFN
jgi:hypothetical protein